MREARSVSQRLGSDQWCKVYQLPPMTRTLTCAAVQIARWDCRPDRQGGSACHRNLRRCRCEIALRICEGYRLRDRCPRPPAEYGSSRLAWGWVGLGLGGWGEGG